MKRWNLDTKRLAEMAAEGKTYLEIAKEIFPNEEIWISGNRNKCVFYDHLQRHMRYHGIQVKHAKRDVAGERRIAWKGGRTCQKNYIRVYAPDHPNRTKDNTMAEHRLAMEKKLGRYLTRKEVVHHIDGNLSNNHPDNLELYESNAAHLKHELTGKIPKWTPQGRENIRQGILKKWYP